MGVGQHDLRAQDTERRRSPREEAEALPWKKQSHQLKSQSREIVLYLPERAPGLMAMVCAFCSRHDRLLRASVAKILLFSSVAWSTRSTRPQMVDLPWRLRPPTSAWLC
jgi:hypothetical protein